MICQSFHVTKRSFQVNKYSLIRGRCLFSALVYYVLLLLADNKCLPERRGHIADVIESCTCRRESIDDVDSNRFATKKDIRKPNHMNRINLTYPLLSLTRCWLVRTLLVRYLRTYRYIQVSTGNYSRYLRTCRECVEYFTYA